ncbi:PspA/IM30 family protein [Subtercola sp. YIM 133946]|uniref:PspA/IM30 family protein n=1 Tax=Subtercola sp. YIM 133946 TaxID=3118909 RepID=UPI002F9545D0
MSSNGSSNTSRMRTIFRTKSSKALDRMEDPRDALDDSYNQQVAMLQQVRRALADVATAKKRVELQGQEMGARYQKLADQAQEALNQGRDDLARTALERRSLLERQVVALRDQHAAVTLQQTQLQQKEQRLAASVEAFRTEKETIKALYSASEAQVRANEAVAGIGSAKNDVGLSLERAKDRVAQMQARAAATDELLSSGALNDLTAAPDADLERQLAAGAMASDVDRQLREMKSGGARPMGTRTGPDSWLTIAESSPTP